MTHPTIEAMARRICKLYDGNPDDILGHDEFTGPIYRWHGHRGAAADSAAVLFDALAEPSDDMLLKAWREKNRSGVMKSWWQQMLAQARTDTLGQPRQSDLTADDGAEGGGK